VFKCFPPQLLVLGRLLERNLDVESEAKQKTYLVSGRIVCVCVRACVCLCVCACVRTCSPL